MYNFSYSELLPSRARFIVAAGRLNGAQISDQVRELAAQDCFDTSLIPFTLNKAHRGIIQQCLDWRGRGVVLSGDTLEQATIGVGVALYRQAKRILVVCAHRNQKEWLDFIQVHCPDDQIANYTNAAAVGDARWVMISGKDLVKSKILSEFTFDQVLIEDIGQTKTSIGFMDGFFRECPHSLVLAAPCRLSSTYAPGDLHNPKSATVIELAYLLQRLWDSRAHNILLNLDGPSGSYLRSRGYLSVSPMDILPMLGVFTALER